MARFDVFALSSGNYVLDVQSDIIVSTRTRAVLPLLDPSTVPQRVTILHPVFDIDGEPHVLGTHLIATLPEGALTRKVGSLATQADEITRALDWLFQGF